MDLSCNLPPGPDTVAHIALAEQLGYRRAWVYDSPALYWDPWMTLALAARETSHIGLGVSVVVPSLRHVMVTASALGTLEAIAPGRVAAVIGTGFTGRKMFGQRALPWSTVTRYVRDLRTLLRGEEIDIDGARTRMGQPASWFPGLESVPLLVAAAGPKGVAAAREVGDGIVAMGAPQPGFAWSAFATGGTLLEPHETLASPRVVDALAPGVAVTYHFLYETNPAALSHIPGGTQWRARVEQFPEQLRHLEVHGSHCVAVPDWERPFLDMSLAQGSLVGSADDIRARLHALEEAGATEIAYGPFGDIPRELRAMAEIIGHHRPTG